MASSATSTHSSKPQSPPSPHASDAKPPAAPASAAIPGGGAQQPGHGAAVDAPPPPRIQQPRGHAPAASDWVEKQKQEALEKHAERMQSLYKQKQLMTFYREKEDACWRRRQEKFDLMKKRMLVSNSTSAQVSAYLRDRSAIFDAFENRLRLQATEIGQGEQSSLRKALLATDLLRSNAFAQHSEMRDRVFSSAIERSQAFADGMQQRSSYLQEAGDAARVRVERAKQATETSWSAYEVAMAEGLRQEAAGASPATDPFLAGREYDRQSHEYRSVLDEYGKSMSKLFRELVTADGRRIDETKALLLDFLIAEKAVATNRVKLLENCIEYIKGIDRERDVESWVREGEFLQPQDPTKSVFDFVAVGAPGAPSGRGAAAPAAAAGASAGAATAEAAGGGSEVTKLIYREVERYGKLFRQGRFISMSWKPVWAVVTRSGFLHYFLDRNSPEPEVSVPLAAVSVQLLPDAGEHVFELSVPNTSFFSLTGAPTRIRLKCSAEAEMVEWVVAVNKYIRRD